MVNMEVEVISREMIRPSSPTPSHLRTFKFSLLDQLYLSTSVPIILYYPTSDGNRNLKQVMARLKGSLSETLSRFYPLAGRVKDHLSIDCNDEGVLFSEARVNCQLSEILTQSQIDLLDCFVPFQVTNSELPNTATLLAFQVNKFTCGGLAICVVVSHKIVDGGTVTAFLKCWAAYTSGMCYNKEVTQPSSSSSSMALAASLFPPREQLPQNMAVLKPKWMMQEGKGIRRRFVFDSASILALKAKASSQFVPNPSRVLVVVGFVWKCAMAASASRVVAKGGSQKGGSIMVLAVNMRTRIVPPCSEYSIGNILWQSMVHHQEETELHRVVGLLREGVAKINDDFVRSLQGDEGFSRICKLIEEADELHSREKPEVYVCTSWCNIGFNELDFGWGKPIWFSPVCGGVHSPMFVNHVVLTETRWGSIEAWVLLDEPVMDVLEHDPEFRCFASMNPSIPMLAPRL